MNMRLLAVIAWGVGCLLVSSAVAQVPQVLNYQGRVIVGSTNFNGTGLFAFALVNTNGTTTYWSNDGTSSGGSQPTSAVSLTVTNGLYSVLLGDTTIANMPTAIPISIFNNPDVRLRVWFNDGTHGSQLLTPDQRLAATGYAFMAGGVNLPTTTSATNGVLQIGGNPFLHGFGTENTFVGQSAGNFTMSGANNTASGEGTLATNTTGSNNTASGVTAMALNTTGSDNTAIGDDALLRNTTGGSNTAIGESALQFNTTAGQNVALGLGALLLQSFSNGGASWNSNNVAVGYNALSANNPTATSNGIDNTALGFSALGGNTTGAGNIGLGYQAGLNLTTGSNNIDIGNVGVAGESSIIRIGDGSTQTDTYLTGIVHGNGSGLTGITSTSFVSNLTLSGNTTFSGDLNLSATNSSATVGVVNIGGTPFLQAYGHNGLGDENTFLGYTAGDFSLTGHQNTGLGGFALNALTSGSLNTAVGANALQFTSNGSENTAVGYNALGANNTAGRNTAIGSGALSAQSFSNSGTIWNSNNVAVGYNALTNNAPTSTTNGVNNTAVGSFSLVANSIGTDNAALGATALTNNSTAGENVAVGSGALATQSFNNGGAVWNSDNVAVGYQALNKNQPTSSGNGLSNTALGWSALVNNTTGAGNIAIGASAGSLLTTGNSNIDIGNNGAGGESGIIRIGTSGFQTDTFLTGSVHATAVGIGITASHGTLDVSGDTGSYTLTSTNAGFNGSSSGIAHFGAGTPASAIYANGGIVTTESFIAVSDARVKLVLGRSDAARDLDTLRAIAVTDFRYKDVIAHGEGVHKKVIAQELEQVFPQAVSQRTGEVPDIYQRATIGADGWIELATNLKVGERVKLIGEQSQGVYNVNAVEATRFRTDFQPAANAVIFVYGREVQDFRAVDYEAIAMLNVSATQELARQVTAAEQEKAALKQRVTDLEARLAKLERQSK